MTVNYVMSNNCFKKFINRIIKTPFSTLHTRIINYIHTSFDLPLFSKLRMTLLDLNIQDLSC